MLNFKVDALEDSFLKHLDRRRQAVWAEYLVKVLFDRFGYQITLTKANEYYDANKSAFEVAETIMIKLYSMHLIEIPDINYRVNMPEEIPEMTNDQFVYLAGLINELYHKQISLDDLKTRMALKFLNVRSSRKAYEKLADSVRGAVSENVSKIAEMLDFFFTLEEDTLRVNVSFTKNFVPKLKVPFWLNYHGPAEALTDINFLEYKDASKYYRDFRKDENMDDLNRMIAVLYRPKFFKWKLPYWPQMMERRARRIGKLPIGVRYAVYLFMLACEEFLREATIDIDGHEIKLQLLYEQTVKEKQRGMKQKYEANTGLAGVALSLAGTGIFGNIKEVYNQNLYDVLLLLYKQRIEYLNQLENY